MSQKILLKNANVCTPELSFEIKNVVCADNKIVYVGDKAKFDDVDYVLDCTGLTLSPGFIDLHIHGSGGGDATGGSIESIEKIAKSVARFGTTSFLPTITMTSEEKLETTLNNIKQHMRHQGCRLMANVLGVHLETPFVNEKMKGAIPETREPSVKLAKQLISQGGETLKIVTLAPELEGMCEIIELFVTSGVIVSLGHTRATYSQSLQALECGASHFAHLFNASSSITARDPGVVGAGLYSDSYIEIIADGHHVHKDNIKAVAKLKSMDKICLVTDAIRVAGTSDTSFVRDSGMRVEVRNGRTWGRNDMLVGSVLTQNVAVKNFRDWTGVPLERALSLVTKNPAEELGLYPFRGAIAVGSIADIVVLNDELDVVYTIVGGRLVHEGECRS